MGTLEAYRYLGLDTVVERNHPQPGVNLTALRQTALAEPDSDSQDPYLGLDRFGRVAEQRWLKTGATPTWLDYFAYGHDADGNRLYRDNLVNPAFGELYHADGPTQGYDDLDRLTAFARGSLTDTSGDDVPDAVPSPTASQSWALDALGNWQNVTTNPGSGHRSGSSHNTRPSRRMRTSASKLRTSTASGRTPTSPRVLSCSTSSGPIATMRCIVRGTTGRAR